MPVQGIDPTKCRARNARVARRGLNAASVTLRAEAPGPIDTNDPSVAGSLRIITAKGKLPSTIDGALERINALRGDSVPSLTAEQVYVVYMEAGNSNFVRKYFLHLGESTLRRIATSANRGIAFMNSHRTGDMSTPSELPFGRSFAGRYEQAITPDGRTFSRTLIGVYMLRGEYPNGASGPSTDSLYKGIQAGTIFDVSLGLGIGTDICDVCGNDLRLYDTDEEEFVCQHVPGTHHKMSEDEIKAQLTRGVPDGVATYTLEDATANEVSSVYDGALPGAGFRKALRVARSRQLSSEDVEEARRAFAPFLSRRDFDPHPQPRGNTMPPVRTPSTGINVAEAFRFWKALGEPETIDLAALPGAIAGETRPMPTPAPEPTPERPQGQSRPNSGDPQLEALHQQVSLLSSTLEQERTARQEEAERQRRETIRAQAELFADQQVRLNRATPAERHDLATVFTQAALDDHASPTQVPYKDAKDVATLGTRVDALRALWTKRGTHGYTENRVQSVPTTRQAATADSPFGDLTGLAPQAPVDPIGDQMAATARKYGERRNGHGSNGTARN